MRVPYCFIKQKTGNKEPLLVIIVQLQLKTRFNVDTSLLAILGCMRRSLGLLRHINLQLCGKQKIRETARNEQQMIVCRLSIRPVRY